MAKKKYTFHDVEVPEVSGLLSNKLPLLRKILYKRGYQTEDSMMKFLFGELDESLDQTEMQGTKEALPLLKKAIKDKVQIIVYQDYDVDGCCAGAICLEAMRNLGAKIDSYVNDREVDGYGICQHGIDQILSSYPETKLIITVDNGIVANEAIEYAKSKGLTVIVTDHHLPGQDLPKADAVIDPKREDEFYSFHDLCGAGVIFKLMLALYDYMKKSDAPVLNTIDIVALATVADIVPLVGENRDLVREGLKMMNDGNRPAFRMMKELLDVKGSVNAHHTIAFIYAPMINALSRMGENPYLATEVLMSSDEDFLKKNIMFMSQVNQSRKEQTDQQEKIAMEILESKGQIGSSIILYSPHFTEGIIGIVAGRLKNEFNRPTVIFAPSADNALKASCRSIDAFPLKENLDKIADLMIGYGGHTKAAGLSIAADKLDAFSDAFRKLTDQLPPESFIVTQELDDVLSMDEVTIDQIQELKLLEPYGEGNPRPIFGLVFHADLVRFMGENGKHVKYFNKDHNLSIIEWNGGEAERKRQAAGKTRTKVIGKMELNEFNGTVSPQFIVES